MSLLATNAQQVQARLEFQTSIWLPVHFPAPGTTAGCDFSGVIAALGPPNSKAEVSHDQQLKVGQRVCGAVYGSNPLNPEQGAFAEYVLVDADMLLHVAASMSWAEAAAIGGIGHGTVNLAMWQVLKLDGWPSSGLRHTRNEQIHSEHVLVYGGNTATGGMAIQLMKA